jgi:hypothetical protein
VVELVDEARGAGCAGAPARRHRAATAPAPSAARRPRSARPARPARAAACSCRSPRRRRWPASRRVDLEVDAAQHLDVQSAFGEALGQALAGQHHAVAAERVPASRSAARELADPACPVIHSAAPPRD